MASQEFRPLKEKILELISYIGKDENAHNLNLDGITQEMEKFEHTMEQASAVLDETYNFHEMLSNSANLNLIRVDTNSIITYANDSFLKFFKFELNNVIGKHLQSIFSPAFSTNLISDNDLSLQSNQPLITKEDFTFDTIDRKRFMQILRTPIWNIDGEVTGIQIVMWDITENSQTETMLKNSEYRYRKFVDDSSDLFVIANGEGNLKFVGENCERIIGYTKKEFLDLNILEYIHLDDIEAIKYMFKRASDLPGLTQKTNGRFKQKNDKWVWYELLITNMTFDNLINGIIINFRDITSRIEAQKSIIEAESRYSHLFNFLPDAIVLIDPETTFSIEFNKAAYLQLGYTKEEFSKLSIQDYDAVESPELTQRRIKRIIEFGEDEFETVHRHKNGSLKPVLVNVKVMSLNGKNFILSMYRDLTAYKSNIADKEESEGKFKTLIENAFDGIYLLSGRNYTYANSSFCKITGYSKEEITSSTFDLMHLLTPQSKEIVEDRFKKCQNNPPEESNYELQITSKSGELKYIEISNRKVTHEGRDSIIGIVREITDRKQSENVINEAKVIAENSASIANNILNNLGHELRTPLNGILGFTRLLKADVSDEDQIDMIRMIEMSGERLKKTLSALLVLTELDSLKYQIMFESCELNTFVSMYDRTTIDIIKEKPVDFVLQLADYEIEFDTDEYLLHQAIYEILDNAYKFTDTGTISLSVGKMQIENMNKAFIEIADSGIGISHDKLEQIFEPFRQGSEGIQRRHEGMGLGLTIVKKIISKLKGSVQVESEVNGGTKIRMLFDCN